jgi:hypothetical protein
VQQISTALFDEVHEGEFVLVHRLCPQPRERGEAEHTLALMREAGLQVEEAAA